MEKLKMKNIAKHYKKLVSMTNKHLFIGIINEWILDNYYLIMEEKQNIKNSLNNKEDLVYLKKNIDIFKITKTILEKHNYKIDEKILIKELSNYQKKYNYIFLYKELSLFPLTCSILLINKIEEICNIENNKLKEKNYIDKQIKKMRKNSRSKIEDYFIIKKNTSKYFIKYLNEQIKELGSNSANIFKEFNELLNANENYLRDVIKEEYFKEANINIIITNTFYSINKIHLLSLENLYDKVSITEKLLINDKIYEDMSEESKQVYRDKIIKNAKKLKIDEDKYVQKLLNKEEHIGKFLFKKFNSKKRTIIYLVIIIILTFFLTWLLGNYFIKFKILGFIVLLIPVSELVISLVNNILMRIFKPKALMKMNYDNGISTNNKTMVVIPTIIHNEKKIEEMFNNLERYYLLNNTPNIYFTLLGDCFPSMKETCDEDEILFAKGKNKVKELNKKYNKELFFFAYRKRKYNVSEEEYIGYERKRGALLEFNDLLINNYTKEELNKIYYGHTFDNFNEEIKYVITLDADTELSLNSAAKLVATMSHPLNKPVLDKKNTKVIDGYALMQPNVSIDIASTNKSIFSQIFAGIGGFDSYSSVSPNFYQDVFSEGTFFGKGIYDLEVFQTVLKDKFPENLILSHDLIEGSYIRCANVSDIDLIDGFPSKYLSDAKRRSRWARGDMQVSPWLFKNVPSKNKKKNKNEILLLSKWKIFDNLRLGFLNITLLLIIIGALLFGIVNPVWWLLFTLFIVMLPIVFNIINNMHIRKNRKVLKYYNMLTYGFKAWILRTIIVFISIPYNAYLYIDSFIRSLYRMYVSKKNLLNWITSDKVEAKSKTDFISVIKSFYFNYLVSVLLIAFSLFLNKNEYLCVLVSLLFITAPIFIYIISKNNNYIIIEEDKDDKQMLFNIAKKTWKFFEDKLIYENNYLIPDNYQLNRGEKDDIKTSPTNIGMSLISVVSAYELKFISEIDTVNYLKQIINTIKKLKKWNGHLYNWYNIHTLDVMYPHFVSSVDSGNFIASLIVVKEFLFKINEFKLADDINKIIKDTDFKCLYTKDDVFSVGFNDNEERLEPYCYNKFASESRITSYVAIAKGDVSSRHWFKLEKSLTVHKGKKGLISWSGTSFEYFMPLIFFKSFPNTLLDETYHFACETQKDFCKEINSNLPWGISESAYNELDDSQNYKYKSFGTPYLKLKEESIDRIVISPYSSILALSIQPKNVIDNIKLLKKYNLYGEYGFYEAYDADDKTVIYSYYAHHQGMILGSITNYLTDNLIQKYFESDTNIKAFEILNKEKVQLQPIINIKSIKYKKYTYNKESFENDMRIFNYISETPEISILSNGKYTTLLNDRGNGFTRYRTIQLNRYRKISEQDYGMFLYIKDLSTKKLWSNTYSPTNVVPDKYEVVFNLDRIKYVRTDDYITTTTEVVVAKMHNAEIRKIVFRNLDKKKRVLELTSYTEPIICDNNDDIAHRAFNNMFIKSSYDEDTNSIIMKRKSKNTNSTYYIINRLLVINPENKFQYETDRTNFIGRGNSAKNPEGINKKLSNYIGTSLDPIISLRNTISLAPGEEETVYFIVGFGKSKEQVMNIVNTYNDETTIEETAFKIATIITNVTNKMINITGNDMRIYNVMLNYLYQTSKLSITDSRIELLKQNKLGQNGLWKYGISGDIPFIFVDINSINDLSAVKELLHAFEYYKSKSIFVDLVFLNVSDKKEAEIILKEIENEKYHMYAINSFNKIPGSIFVIDRELVNNDEYILLSVASRFKVDTKKYESLWQFVNELQSKNTINTPNKVLYKESLKIKYDTRKLTFFNEFGGFNNNGREYVIVNKNTPCTWSNVIANKDFGTIVTNNNTGYTYAENSHDYKLTSWTNDSLLNDYSEEIKLNDTIINFDIAKHGFGYSEFAGNIDGFKITYTNFVAKNDAAKLYNILIKNNNSKKELISLKFWINPILGVVEDKTARHILTDYDKENNFITMRNVYNSSFNNLQVFMSSTEKIIGATIDQVIYKEIEVKVELKPNEEKNIGFTLGIIKDGTNDINIVKKYQDITNIFNEYTNIKKYWNDTLNTIIVDTPDISFNYMMNGWLLYQTISSRINAKAGFYQVSGAFGYRDQLQDSTNLCTVLPDITRKQILINASHQFIEGDVLHWWHEYNKTGIRSQFKDDYLWLVYTTSEYIKITDDKSLLNEDVPYIDGIIIEENEKEKYGTFNYTEKKETIYEHCNKSILKSMNSIGNNGLPLMGGGDWNDGMNEVGINGKGTSIWLGFFLYIMIERFIDITKIYNNKIDIKIYVDFNTKLKKSLLNTWDGNYYLRAYFDNGNKLGSHECNECSIDLISQCFAILSNISTKEQNKLILKSIDEKLYDKDLKIVKLLTPAFENNKDNPGYIMNYPKGIRENGGEYTHAVSWYVMSLLKLGMFDKAYEIYQMINPINRTKTKSDALKYAVEPYVIAADIYSNNDYKARGGWTWYTGSAGWFYKVGLDIIGFNKKGNKLYINPKIPSKWNSYKITYKYLSTVYEINIFVSSKESIQLDNKIVNTDYIELINDSKIHIITINIRR